VVGTAGARAGAPSRRDGGDAVHGTGRRGGRKSGGTHDRWPRGQMGKNSREHRSQQPHAASVFLRCWCASKRSELRLSTGGGHQVLWPQTIKTITSFHYIFSWGSAFVGRKNLFAGQASKSCGTHSSTKFMLTNVLEYCFFQLISFVASQQNAKEVTLLADDTGYWYEGKPQ
jgi:hypothetical protein